MKINKERNEKNWKKYLEKFKKSSLRRNKSKIKLNRQSCRSNNNYLRVTLRSQDWRWKSERKRKKQPF
jgi:hypothetical protein